MPRLRAGGAEAAVSEAGGGGRVDEAGGKAGRRTERRAHDAGGAGSSLQSEGGRVRKSRGVGTVADQGEQNARIRDTPSSASRIGDGERGSRRPQARNAGKRQKRTWHALQQADVEVHLVPLDDDALDLGERERGRRLPLLRRLRTRARGRAVSNGLLGTARAARTPGGPADLQDQVVQRVADAVVLAVERICRRGKKCLESGRRAARRARGYKAHPESGLKKPEREERVSTRAWRGAGSAGENRDAARTGRRLVLRVLRGVGESV